MGFTRFLAGALVAVGVWMLALPALAEEAPQRKNCPEGFIWDRNSGTACIQETYRPHGRLGYDGHSICDEGFVGIYEQRPTTDGKGVPGNPATSYAYLLECMTPSEFADRQSRVDGGAQLGDAAGLLASSGTPLPPGQLVLLGALGSGAMIFAAIPMLRARPGRSAEAPKSQPATTEEEEPDQPPGDEESLTAEELKKRIATLDAIDKDLATKMEEYRRAAEAGRLTPQDVVTWAGIIADIASLVPVAQLPAGIASLAANIAGILGEQYSTRDLDRAIRTGLGAMARLRGMIDVELGECREALTEADRPQGPQVPPVPPEVLPDDALATEHKKAHRRTVEAARSQTEATEAWGEKSRQLREHNERIGFLTDHLPDLNKPPLSEAAQESNVWLDLAAGLDAMARYHKTDPAARASDAMMQIFRGEAPGSFSKALDHAVDLGTEARTAGPAGKWAGGVSAASAAMSAYQWFQSRSVEEQRVLVEQAIEGLRHQQGRMEAEVQQAEDAMRRAQAESNAQETRRKVLSKELDQRAARKGKLLWGD